MSETKTNLNPGAERVSKLEGELKAAFKEGRLEVVKRKSEELLKLDPGNRLATRVLEKALAEEAVAIRKNNAVKIRDLESKMEQALKEGNLPTVNFTIVEIRKLDPGNRKAMKTLELIDRAKADLERELRTEKARKIEGEIGFLVVRKDWEAVTAKANELLALEWGNKVALNAIGKAAESKHVDPKTLITAKAPVVEGKPGFFARLFGHKAASPSKAPAVVVSKPLEAKPATVPAPVAKVELKPIAPVVAAPKVEPKPAVAERSEIKVAPVAKIVPKDEKKLEADMRKEKIAGLGREIVENLKEGKWAKVADKANELLGVDWGNAMAVKAIKRAAEAQKVQPYELVKATAPKDFRSFGFFAKLMGSKADVPAKPVVMPVAAKPVVVPSSPKVEAKPLAPMAKPAEVVAKAVAPVMIAAKPVETPKPGPMVAPVAQKPLAAAPAAPKDPASFGLFAKLMGSKADVPAKPVVMPVAAKPVVVPSSPKLEAKPLMAEAKAVEAARPEPMPMVSPAIALSAPVPQKPVVLVVPAQAVQKSVEAPKAVPVPVKAQAPVAAPVAKVVAPVAPVQLKVEQQAVAKAGVAKSEEGNIFTRLFGEKAEGSSSGKTPAKAPGSVLETIVAAQAAPAKKAESKSRISEGMGDFLPKFANALLQFAAVFIVISAVFFYVENKDTGNQVLSRFGGLKSHASQLHEASTTIDGLRKEKEDQAKEISKYSGKDALTNDTKTTVEQIVASRMDWSDMLRKLNEITETVYAKNSLSQYVQYNSYSYNVQTGRFTVSGTLSDPLGKNLTKLAELEQALRTYPKDPENPEDKTTPYFYGFQEFNAYAKSFNAKTGRYQSTFTMALSTKPNVKKK